MIEYPEQNKRYVIETMHYGDVTVMRVPTPDVFALEENARPYEEDTPVYFDNERWHCLDWTGEPNEFVLALAKNPTENDPLDSPSARRDVLAIMRGAGETFQRAML